MNFVNILDDDIVDSDDGVCTSLWFGGCDIRCPGCHNETLWNWDNQVDNQKVLVAVVNSLLKGPTKKSLSILGGEPLSKANRADCLYIVKHIRESLPLTVIRVWTGHIYEDLLKENDPIINEIFENIDFLIDGPFKKDETVVGSLKLRGSLNQRIIPLKH